MELCRLFCLLRESMDDSVPTFLSKFDRLRSINSRANNKRRGTFFNEDRATRISFIPVMHMITSPAFVSHIKASLEKTDLDRLLTRSSNVTFPQIYAYVQQVTLIVLCERRGDYSWDLIVSRRSSFNSRAFSTDREKDHRSITFLKFSSLARISHFHHAMKR